MAGCTTDTDCCGAGKCSDGRCTPPGVGGLGSRCARKDDCRKDLICMAGFPRGECLPPAYANVPCSPTRCPSGTRCIARKTASDELVSYCLRDCDTSDAEGCGPHAACTPHPTESGGVCDADCESTGCAPGATCDGATGRCLCSADSQCDYVYGSAVSCDVASNACVCKRQCDGKSCGPDGCGGTCGTCSVGTACSDSGTCVAPFCGAGNFVVPCSDGATCPNNSHCVGSDSCECDKGYVAKSCAGGSCSGGCEYPNWWCARCTPNCSGRTCGSDGCGGSCGTCGSGTCDETTGRCTTSGGGGGGCGTCPSGWVCADFGGTSVCTPRCTSHAECTTGCCATGIDGSRACSPKEYCGTAPSCHDRTGCVSGEVRASTSGCPGYHLGKLHNNCGETVVCTFRFVSSAKTDIEGSVTINPGQTLDHYAGIWSCGHSGSTSLEYLCALPSDPPACTDLK